MSTYVEYQLEDGMTILVEVEEDVKNGLRPTNRDGSNTTVVKATQSFENALDGIKKSATAMKKTFESLQADEVEVTFGLKTVGEMGLFAVGKVGVEANYVVKLKWVNTAQKPK